MYLASITSAFLNPKAVSPRNADKQIGFILSTKCLSVASYSAYRLCNRTMYTHALDLLIRLATGLVNRQVNRICIYFLLAEDISAYEHQKRTLHSSNAFSQCLKSIRLYLKCCTPPVLRSWLSLRINCKTAGKCSEFYLVERLF